MNKNIIIAILVFLVLLFAGLFVLSTTSNDGINLTGDEPTASLSPETSVVLVPTLENTPTTIKTNGQNFLEEGNLSQRKGEDGWFLIYEEPGSPALSVELNFPDEWTCRIGGNNYLCTKEILETGKRVKISGQRNDDLVVVDELEFM